VRLIDVCDRFVDRDLRGSGLRVLLQRIEHRDVTKQLSVHRCSQLRVARVRSVGGERALGRAELGAVRPHRRAHIDVGAVPSLRFERRQLCEPLLGELQMQSRLRRRVAVDDQLDPFDGPLHRVQDLTRKGRRRCRDRGTAQQHCDDGCRDEGHRDSVPGSPALQRRHPGQRGDMGAGDLLRHLDRECLARGTSGLKKRVQPLGSMCRLTPDHTVQGLVQGVVLARVSHGFPL
jgi:hypothetical protein